MWASVLFKVFQSTLLQPELSAPAICPGVLIHQECQALSGAGCQGRLHRGSATWLGPQRRCKLGWTQGWRYTLQAKGMVLAKVGQRERERGADVAVGRRAGKGMTSNQVNGGKKMRRDSVGPTWLEMLERSNWWSPAPTRPINTFVCLTLSLSIPGNASIGRISHKKPDLPTVGCDRQRAESFGWQSTPHSHLECTGHTHTGPLSPLDPFLLFGTSRFGRQCAQDRGAGNHRPMTVIAVACDGDLGQLPWPSNYSVEVWTPRTLVLFPMETRWTLRFDGSNWRWLNPASQLHVWQVWKR